ncbi:MAG: hypothetical protein MUF75_02630 [Bacteroidia bacterium]|nr:hypothetical protein [Bacteroidia bacterium]
MQESSNISAAAFLKQYEFALFDRIIRGDLSPSVLSSIHTSNYLHLLGFQESSFYYLTIAVYKSKAGNISLTQYRKLFCLHPTVIWLRLKEPSLFDHPSNSELNQNIITELNLRQDEILSYSFNKQNNKTTFYIKTPAETDALTSNEVKFYYYSKMLNDEVARIKLAIHHNVVKCESHSQTEHYIHNQQQALASLFLQMHKLLAPSNFKDVYTQALDFSPKDILNLTYAQLEHLIRFLEKNYLKYVDSSIEIAHRTALIKYYGLDYKFKRVKSVLMQAPISAKLVEALFKPFTKIDALYGPEKITYRELNYFNTYISYIQEFLNHTESLNDAKLFQLLVAINYNSLHILSLRVDFLLKQIENHNSPETKIDFLYAELKSLNQIQQYAHLAFSPNMPSLKAQITSWIEEEIQYLSRKLLPKKLQQINYPAAHPDRVKIKSGLPVSQLAYFFRLLSDTGVIDHKNQRDIFRFIADNFVTTKTSEISPESISSKYYTPEGSTVDAVRSKIIELLNRAKED